MLRVISSTRIQIFHLLISLISLTAIGQTALPFTETFTSAYSSHFYSSGGTTNGGSTDACILGNNVAVFNSSSTPYLETKALSVSPGKGIAISFDLKNGGSFTAPEVYLRVNDPVTFSTSNTTDNDWVKVGTGSISGCSTNTINVSSDIVGGQRICVTIYFKNVSSINWVSIDNLSITETSGSGIQTSYSETFANNAWYNSSSYVKIPYHSSNTSTGSNAYLFNGGVGGFSDYYVSLSPKIDITAATNIITEEVNTSGYSKGELRYNFKSQYPCGGPNSYTNDEGYSFNAPKVSIMNGADNGSNSWTLLTVNSYFPDNTWRYVAVDISAYKSQSVKVRFEQNSFCSSPADGVDNIKILDRDCSISSQTAGAITGTTSPSANTNYNYSIGAVTGASYYKWIVRNGGSLYETTPYIVSGQGTQNVTINFGSLAAPLRVICIPYDANPTSNTSDACYAKLGKLDMVSCTPPVISSADSIKPSSCGGSDGSIKLNGLTASTSYSLTYNKNGSAVGSASYLTDGSGVLTLTGLTAGTYNNFVVTLSGCSSAAFPVSDSITISDPTGSNVATPVFALGAVSTRCVGAATVNYGATAINNTGISYSLDGTSTGAGNSINASTGDVTYASSYTGTSVITATATGCGGPVTAKHTVTITANVGVPVFGKGATSTRCLGADTSTYSATAAASTNISYALDATSLNAGNTINAATGKVTYVGGYSGTATITATATGCGNSTSAMHTVTITPAVTKPVFDGGIVSARCSGVGTVVYAATSNNTTGITYSFDAAAINAGNTIAASTGSVNWASNYSGTATITASAAGCNGPDTTTLVITVTPVVGTPVFSLGSVSSHCQGADTITYTASASNSSNITYTLDGSALAAGNTIDAATGKVIFKSTYTGSAFITATAAGCNGPASAVHTVTISPVTGTPVFDKGASSVRCKKQESVIYTATASNSTGISYSLDATSLNAGNTINPNTGEVSYTANYTGTATITATAVGCGNPTTASHTVTITAPLSAPVFNDGSSILRCKGAATVAYIATADNSTGITYSLNPASVNAGNSINANTGAVTWAADYTGTTTVTASAAGCNGPLTSDLTITVSLATGTPSFSLGNVSTHCQGAVTVTYTATAANSTGITYSLDPTSLSAGNTIDANTGAVTFTSGFTGTAVVSALASGCGTATTASHIVTVTPAVSTPVFTAGSTTSRCKGAATVSYPATADNNTGITYSIDGTSSGAGNSINSANGDVTWAPGYTGNTTVTASAAGCGGPKTAILIISVTASASTPVFDKGSSTTRCQGTDSITYSASADNSTAISYTLDIPALAAGNTINAVTGGVKWVANYSGTATITATATGCGNSASSTHTVTVTPSVSAPVFNGGNSSSGRCSGTSSTVNYSASANNTTGITYSLDAASINAGNTINASTGDVHWVSSFSGTATITASAAGCNGPAFNTLQVLFSAPAGTPVFSAGASSEHCQGILTTSYPASATNSLGVLYRLDGDAIAAGNSIDSTTGLVTWSPGYSGTATITAIAIGCGSPTATHTVTVDPQVTTPVFAIGPSSTRCKGAGSVSYAATAVNNTGITYSLDATSGGAGNSINTANGTVTWLAGYSGTATITATATGCNGPVSATHTVTITNNNVGTPVFDLGTTSTRCIGTGSTVYSATAANSSSITYSLDGTSQGAGNTINANTGEVSWASNYSGLATITATAQGCNGPASATHTVTITNGVVPAITITADPGNTICAGTPVTFKATISNGGATPTYQWLKNTLPVGTDSMYIDAGLLQGDQVSCALTSSATCVSQAHVTSNVINMVIKQVPGKPIASANTPLCENDALQLNCPLVSNAIYSWTGPGAFSSALQSPFINNAKPSNSGNYIISVTVNGCTSPADTLNVLVRPAPATPTISQSGNTLTSTTAAHYQWYLADNSITGATSKSYVPDHSGSYSVQVTDSNGCSATSAKYIYKLTTGLNEVAEGWYFNIYPNPVTYGTVELLVSPELVGKECEVFDISGKEVMRSMIRDEKSGMDISLLGAGIYFVKVEGLVKKLIRQ